jgi:hypothetical protein
MQFDGPHHRITGRTLLRRNVEAAIAAATMPIVAVECDLQGVDLSRLDLTRFTFDRCTFIESNLSHVVATATRWIACRGRQAGMRGADLADAVFEGGDWNNVDWSAAMLSGARFQGVKLTGSGFAEAKSLGTVFTDCPMQRADLKGRSFRKGRMGRCDMTGADLRDCDMRQTSFDPGSSLAAALVAGAKFAEADLRNVDLSGHGIDSLRTFSGARIGLDQAAALVAACGLKVG